MLQGQRHLHTAADQLLQASFCFNIPQAFALNSCPRIIQIPHSTEDTECIPEAEFVATLVFSFQRLGNRIYTFLEGSLSDLHGI